ncbi:TonB-dependent receptor [Telmatospirillum siberiense]|uniref:TonB-dependent receptor n=1 Tax=Telmatospirillum siberiense TaxID=382514 RepID=A0A2N3PXN2_9PROT|nr:TonB-dependent receptor [Telmatospirillum siberiense]PKU25170.1 hypothetical protein CWS72_08230 [Telmatospirillum siberiense]
MWRRLTLGIFPAVIFCPPAFAEDGAPVSLGEVVVVGVAPVMGSGVDRDKLPVNVQVVDPAALRATGPQSAADLLNARLGAVSVADYAGNPMQPSLSFRGFNASPTLGDSEGLAVYQNGMRLNESFGDLVNWDMNPSFAIDKLQVLPGSNPVFGLNALGGAVTLKMKNGFTNPGTDGEIAAGSFGRARTMVETGQQFGGFGFYTGVAMQTDDGWRQSSRSKLIQNYTDLAFRKEALELGVGVTLAASDLSGLGTSPVQLLAENRSAVFTSPDQTQNALAAIDLRGSYELSDSLSLQGGAYYRHLRTATHNGDASGISACADPNDGILCDDNGPITDRAGNTISSALGGNGINNNTVTLTQSMGASAQITHEGRVAAHANHAVFGVSTDQGWTDYNTNAELGELSSSRAVVGSGVYLGGSSYSVSLGAHNAYYGAYVSDTFSLTDHLHLTAAGRFNFAQQDLQDRLGGALSGKHDYQRFNPSLGLAWQVVDGLTTYVNYSEANRVPTAAELSCADPDQPCRVPNAFVSDPDLKQVIARTWEIGARGRLPAGTGRVEWSLAAFTTKSTDDIIFVSSGSLLGSGYFTNAAATLRQGLEAGLDASLGSWRLFADYGLVRATFDSPLTIQSPNNTAADANGNIQVRRGDRLPGIPLHTLKVGAEYALSDQWSVGSDLRFSSDRVIRGDESNSMPKIPAFAVVNASSSYRLRPGLELFFRVQNIFDRKYATAGTLGNPTSLFPSFTDTRFESPGEPRSFWGGVRVAF